MSKDLVTIATFANSLEANLALQCLEGEGIKAFLMDEATETLAWHLTVAVGWIKLQVFRPDVEQALSILQDNNLLPNQTLTPVASSQIGKTSVSEEEEEERRSWADRIADSAFRAAVIGLVFLPIQFYSLWLLVRLLVSRRRISNDRRIKVIIAALLDSCILIILWAIFRK